MSKTEFSDEVKQIIEDRKSIYEEMQNSLKYQKVDVSDFNIPNIDLLFFMICLDPMVDDYGHGLGLFVYDKQAVYQFQYNIHTPYSKGPRLSNQMTVVEQVVLDAKLMERYGIVGTNTIEITPFQKAFWMHTPDDGLNEQEKSFRTLTRAIQAYCRKENLCEKLRKTDSLYETRVMEQRARFLMENTTYGVTGLIDLCKDPEEPKLAMSVEMQNAMYGVIEQPDPLKCWERTTRDERKLAMNTGAGILPEQKGV